MAYLDLAHSYDTAAVAPQSAPVADAKPSALSPLEWSVVALAQKDRLSSLNTPGAVAIAMRRLFGSRAQTMLADPKLEALRRVAVLAWHRGYAIATAEVRAFKQAGFTGAQYELVLASISKGRDALNQRDYR